MPTNSTSNRISDIDRIVAIVRGRYPLAFPVPVVPLKVGITFDLMADGILTEDEASHLLRDYTERHEYLKVHIEGAPRYDLKGRKVGFVSAENALWARRKIAMRKYAAFRRALVGKLEVTQGTYSEQ